MSDRIKKSWVVFKSVESFDGAYCIDFFVRQDETYGFEEFRRDIEDMGKWTGNAYFSTKVFDDFESALSEALTQIVWLEDRISNNQ